MNNTRPRRRIDPNAKIDLVRLIAQIEEKLARLRAVQAEGYSTLTKEELVEALFQVSKKNQTHKTLTKNTDWLKPRNM